MTDDYKIVGISPVSGDSDGIHTVKSVTADDLIKALALACTEGKMTRELVKKTGGAVLPIMAVVLHEVWDRLE